jgi:DNA polymerase-1
MKPKKFIKSQINLFSLVEKSVNDLSIPWELPNLSKEKVISLDTEGALNIWRGGKPCGMSIAIEDSSRAWYFPFSHKQGFNFELDKLQLWVKDNLVNLDINLANAKHDLNTLKSVGIDLEEGNNRLHDIMHTPALLYSNRQNYDLDSLLEQELGRNKAQVWGGTDYEKYPMCERPSEEIWAYACQDAIDTSDLARHYAPRITAEGLGRVLELEDQLIFAVASMERQGARLDVERLHAWRRQAHNQYIQRIMQLYRFVGARIEPTKPSHMAKLFTILKLDYPLTATGKPSFTSEFLVSCLANPLISDKDKIPIKISYEAIQLASLESKALAKFEKSVDSKGIIRYALNQLKATSTEGNIGAVTGRFSSSGGGKHINGINIQQVMDDEKQEKIDCIAAFPIRDLFIPEQGYQWLSADAKQIEYRLFAHYVDAVLGSDRLSKIYDINPDMDYHDYVQNNILKRPDMPRKIVKNCNFSKIYGVGAKKLAEVYLKCSVSEAKEISDFYDREFPEARQLLNKTIDIVKSRDTGKSENRGWVRTALGRKRQYTNADYRYIEALGRSEIPYYSALNAVIQGTAADIMKLKIKELYDARKETGNIMHFVVHDEVDNSTPDLESALKVKKILNRQSLPLRIPILWSTAIGKTWKQVEEI